MTIEEIKDLWKNQNNDLDQNLKLNNELLKQISMKKVKSLLSNLHTEAWIQLGVGVLFTKIFMDAILNSSTEWKFIFPLLLILFLSISEIITSLYVLLNSHINADTPIVQMQKKINKIIFFQKLDTLSILILTPVFWPLFIIAFLRMINLDAFALLSTHDWIYQIIGSVLVSLIVFWFIIKNPDKNLMKAKKFLKKIKQYEQE